MPRTIFLQIGNKDRISLSAFIDSLRNFLGMLQDLDSTVSRNPSGNLTWDVVLLQKQSPPLIGVSATPKRKRQQKLLDISETVETQLLENTRLLTYSAERNPYMSDAALSRLEKLAKRSKQLGPLTVYVNGEGAVRVESAITENTLKNVQQLTGVKYSGYASVVGKLEAITVHLRDEFRVWDEISGKPVRCKFGKAIEDRVKSLLRSRVAVSGIVKSNSAGIPISVDVEELESAEKGELPTIQEMSGLVEDYTDGKPLKKYLEDLDE